MCLGTPGGWFAEKGKFSFFTPRIIFYSFSQVFVGCGNRGIIGRFASSYYCAIVVFSMVTIASISI